MKTTPQDLLKVNLGNLPIPKRNIDVYGSQIVVTCLSEDAAIRWGHVLRRFATVKRVAHKSIDETKASGPNAKQYVDVWRTWATV